MTDAVEFIAPPYCVLDGTPRGPHGKQLEWHRNPARNKYMSGGLGSGKSLAGARDTNEKVWLNAERLSERGQAGMGLEYICGAPSYQLVHAGAWHHMMAWFEEASVLNGFSFIAKVWETPPRRIQLVTNDLIWFVSLKKARSFAGRNAVGGWLDEAELAEDPMSGFVAINNRLRDARVPASWRFFNVTSTPPRGAFGVIQHFKDQIAAEDPNYAIVHAPTRSNPAADEDYVSGLEATMSERERRQQIEGEIVADEGAVFGMEFDPQHSIDHSWRWYQGVRADREYYLAIDWGTHYHCLLIEHDPKTQTDIVFDEVIADRVQDDEFCDLVVNHCTDEWGLRREDIARVYCDPNPTDAVRVARNRRFWHGKVTAQYIHGRYNDKERGIRAVRWRLQPYRGERRLRFAKRLRMTKSERRILSCMLNYSRAQRVVDGQVISLPNVVQYSPWSHGPDALRAYVWPKYGRQRTRIDERDERAA